MKKILAISALVISHLWLKAQTPRDSIRFVAIPKVDGKPEYVEVVQLDTTYKKDKLYKNEKLFFVNNFKNAKDIIQYDDRDQAKMIGKGVMMLSDMQNNFLNIVVDDWVVNYTIDITAKDGKYKYRIYDITIKETLQPQRGGPPQRVGGPPSRSTSNNPALETDLTMNQVVNRMTQGNYKKVTSRLYDKMVDQFLTYTANIKTYMAKNIGSKDDF